MFQTGFHGDDYSVMNQWSLKSFFRLTPENLGLKFFGLPDYLTFWWAYPVIGYDNPLLFDAIKVLAHLASIVMTWYFFTLFLNRNRAVFASLFFVLWPLHEATTYWYMVAAYVFWPSVIMFSFYLISVKKLKLGIVLATIGAFSFYLSPPYIFGLSLVFFIRKQNRNGFVFIMLGFLYIANYFIIKNAYPFVEKRISKDLDVLMFFKGFALQVMGVIDSFLGPSAFFKLYYSATSISSLSLFFSLALLVALWFILNNSEDKNSSNNSIPFLGQDLIIGSAFVLILSMAMFSLTGLYVPSPFNLGNRSLVYGSLLVAVLLASIRINTKNLILIWFVFVLPVFGISDHWKQWNVKQSSILNAIHNNLNLKTLQKNDLLIVTGNNYDKLGPYSHIEFFNMPWVVASIFKDFAGLENAVPITQTISIEGNFLKDSKYSDIFSVTGNIYIYDSEHNIVSPITLEETQILINERPQEIRHWVQLCKGTFIERIILSLSPRLGYLFKP